MSRYRREVTHSPEDLARLADSARKLRQEMQAMIKNRRRADVRHLHMDRPDLPLKKKR